MLVIELSGLELRGDNVSSRQVDHKEGLARDFVFRPSKRVQHFATYRYLSSATRVALSHLGRLTGRDR